MNSPVQRFSRSNQCPICGGHDSLPRGKGVRCYGFLSNDGSWAHCTRPEYAGQLHFNSGSDSYSHRVVGECYCGIPHNSSPNSNGRAELLEQKHIEDTYDYEDEKGELRYQVVRYSDKSFKLRRPDGNGEWIWNMHGVERLPYRLPELLSAPMEAIVFICEGEKDVDRLRSLGFVATCNSEGAGKFRVELVKWFGGRRVVLLQDNDDAGKRHVEKAANMLYGVAL